MYQWEETTVIHKIKDYAYPTVSLEAIVITSSIEARYGRDVATIDIPGS